MSRNLLTLASFAALLMPATAAGHTDAGWQMSLRWPADGTITSPFGRDGSRWHPGLDIGILRTLDVRAADDGVVVLAGYVPGYDGYGAIVAVEHRDGYSTVYAHLSQPLVRPGQQSSPEKRSALPAARAGARARTSTSSSATTGSRSIPPS